MSKGCVDYGYLKPLEPGLSPIRLRSQTHLFDDHPQHHCVGSGGCNDIMKKSECAAGPILKLTVGESGRAYLTTQSPHTNKMLTTLLRNKDTFVIAGHRYRFFAQGQPEDEDHCSQGSAEMPQHRTSATHHCRPRDPENNENAQPTTTMMTAAAAAAVLSPLRVRNREEALGTSPHQAAAKHVVVSSESAMTEETRRLQDSMQKERETFTPVRLSEILSSRLSPKIASPLTNVSQGVFSSPANSASALHQYPTDEVPTEAFSSNVRNSTPRLDSKRTGIHSPEPHARGTTPSSQSRDSSSISARKGVPSAAAVFSRSISNACNYTPQRVSQNQSISDKITCLSASIIRSRSRLDECESSLKSRIGPAEEGRNHEKKPSQAFCQSLVEHSNTILMLKTEHAAVRFATMASLSSFSSDLLSWSACLMKRLDSNSEAAELKKRLEFERQERRRLHNALIEAEGNIRVHCRIRPLKVRNQALPVGVSESEDTSCTANDAEGDGSSAPVVFSENDEIHVRVANGRSRIYGFDEVYAPETSEDELFLRGVSPLVTSYLDGYHVCIVAYGQTASGKTHSMRNITQRSLACLLDSSSKPQEYSLSMLEIYNETFRDLLTEPDVTPISKLDLLQQVHISSVAEAQKLIMHGESKRAKCPTLLNAHSSRSHSLVVVTNKTTKASLWFVDLAGSECVSKSGVEGAALTEAKHVNRSLAAFGDVLSALGQRQQHIPYRRSKLTHCLSSCLGGEAKMLLLVTVPPTEGCLSESMHTLGFGVRARQVKRGAAVRAKSSASRLDTAADLHDNE
eukprot:ANDGO_07510.mRNA.1 Kinesin-3